jgi:carbonic anhydrase
MFIQSNKETATTHTKKRKRDTSTNQNATLVEWENYLSAAGTLQQINASVVHDINLASLFSSDLTAFWRYTGSLTTPPCTEGIIWTVFKHPINVNDDQLEQLRNNIYSEDFRQPQPIHNRIVYRSFLHEAFPSIADYICCSNKK